MMNMMKNRGNNAPGNMMNPMLKFLPGMRPGGMPMMGFPPPNPGIPIVATAKTGDQENDAIIEKVWPALGLVKKRTQDEALDSNSQNTGRSNLEINRSRLELFVKHINLTNIIYLNL